MKIRFEVGGSNFGFFTDLCCFLVRSDMTFIDTVLFLIVQQTWLIIESSNNCDSSFSMSVSDEISKVSAFSSSGIFEAI